jgi:Protein of unknown function (DUF5672)
MSAFAKFKSTRWECDFRTHPRDAPLCGVLVESRDHPDLEYALRNFSCMIPYAALTIFHSTKNLATLLKIVGPDTNIRFIELPEPWGRHEWIRTSLTPFFWEKLERYERILVFNIDTGIRHNSVLKFLHYDFIGAHWNHFPVGDPKAFQGNGAFSIRNPKLLKEITLRYQCPPEWNEDDIWFVWHMIYKFPGSVLPTRETCAQFSTEGNDISGTMGFHDTEGYTPGAWRVYELSDGPTRRLIDVTSADVDGRDVTALVRLGIGPNGLRIFKETFPHGKFLTLRTKERKMIFPIGEDVFITEETLRV